jgi:formate hydrogenlyase subunit 3/multisubunit Na+/H+ antiporter MnhD subunit
MFFYIFAGICSACAILFLLAKLNIKRVLAFDVVVDIASSALLMVMFFGTFAGMMAAIVGGAIISIVLFVMKKTIGYEKPKWNRYKVQWVNVPPR